MAIRSRRSPGTAAAIVALSALAIGCASTGYRTVMDNGTEQVFFLEKGDKTLVYEISPDGHLTIHDENDPRAQELLEMEREKERARLLAMPREDRLRIADKRKSNDPIRVMLHDVELSDDLKYKHTGSHAMARQIGRELRADMIISIVDPAVAQAHRKTSALLALTGAKEEAGPPSDVEVATKATVKDMIGVNPETQKISAYAVVVLEARITSGYLPQEYKITEEGPWADNAEVARRFAAQVKSVIKDQIGPDIPQDRSL